jgi:iron complex outermembrane receptor protein
MGGVALAAAISCAQPVLAQAKPIDIAPQPLTTALYQLGVQTGQQIIFTPALASSKTTLGVNSADNIELALNQILRGTGLTYEKTADAFMIVRADADPQGGSAAGSGAGTVEALIVTAQKREEDIQDVPIAISAFSQEALERSQIAGGPDLMTQIPNMTFTKTNFASYSIQIRGIGTQAISATTDAAVAVAFNNSSMIRNRFFEQEFYDLQRVEVLRGPQGTLYGRNATAGVVNVISAKPKFVFEAKASADLANYDSTRVEGMVNIPLVEDMVALRVAGAWTKRNGYSINEITGNPIDGRDLWSSRVSLRFSPGDAVDVNLIWEHFEEDDDRLRSGKQLCKKDDRTTINGVTRRSGINYYAALFSQGCIAESLYAPESFQTPDGYSLPYFQPLRLLGTPIADNFDPYRSTTQSRDLRVIESTIDPEYRAKTDVGELQINIEVAEGLTLTSETAYSADALFSMQDYNRFNTASGAFSQAEYDSWAAEQAVSGREVIQALRNGVFCDPQLGCADRLVAVDLSTAKSRQFSQELRLSSDFDGPLNFSVGGNFLRYDTEDKYYVFINALSLYSVISGGNYNPQLYVPGVSDNSHCLGMLPPPQPDPTEVQRIGCTYIDPNPIGNLNDRGHNYFLSRNPYKLISYAVFGELYYNITENLKLTGGLRWTVDKKDAPRIPSWLLSAFTVGYPVAEVVEQEWRAPTGRLALDWKPDFSFTDETLLYASFARGYKAGGANPPAAGVVTYINEDTANALIEKSATFPKTFAPEYINAFEVGSKNALLDGRVTLNLGAFYYDYTGYQISYIVERSAVNLNFDAEVWGLEIEADWRPTDNLRLGLKAGFEDTRVADGSRAIDVMDRTAGNPGWVVARPFPTYPSNCILPIYTVSSPHPVGGVPVLGAAPNVYATGREGPCELAYVHGLDPVTQLLYVANPAVWHGPLGPEPLNTQWAGYIGFNPLDASPGHNNGEGFYKDLSGKELPNAPDFTGTLSADYTVPLRNAWMLTLHSDLYYQSEAWTRIFNTPGYDKLKAYTNLNLAAMLINDETGWKVMAYVKNVLDRDSITGAFLNSDDSGLTTNVFLTEPRLYGLRVTKEWSGGSLLGNLGAHQPGAPYRFTLELGGQVQQHDAPAGPASPSFFAAFSPDIDPRDDQDINLDNGDGRDLKLTYDPGGNWNVSLGARFGKTNGWGTAFNSAPGDTGCQSPKYVPGFCDTAPVYFIESTDWGQVDTVQREAHTIVDFALGYDLGFGILNTAGGSTVSLGLRYAHLASDQGVELFGIPDWDVPSGVDVTSTAHRYRLSADVDHDFEGVGPVISWEASKTLFDRDELGAIDLDWAVGGGVLFGRQKTSVTGEEKTEYLEGYSNVVVDTHITPVAISRSDSATVPTLGASLGVSYSVGGASIGAGYRWERYFDAIDGGYSQSDTFDRTIDGPYFKLSVGFGG